MSPLSDDVGNDGLVGNADADGFLFALEDARDIVVGFKNKGERARQIAFHHFEDIVVDGFGEIAQHTKVVEDERKVGFLLAYAFNLADALKGLGLVDAATQTVKRVGREDDGTSVGQTFQYHLDVSRVRVVRVKFENHRLTIERAKIVKI